MWGARLWHFNGQPDLSLHSSLPKSDTIPTKIRSRMSLHSSTEPSLYSSVKNIFVNHISSRGWLLTVNTVRISNRHGAFVKVKVRHIHTALKVQYGAVWTGGLRTMYGMVNQWLRLWKFLVSKWVIRRVRERPASSILTKL